MLTEVRPKRFMKLTKRDFLYNSIMNYRKEIRKQMTYEFSNKNFNRLKLLTVNRLNKC